MLAQLMNKNPNLLRPRLAFNSLKREKMMTARRLSNKRTLTNSPTPINDRDSGSVLQKKAF
jgi:hypothetical protein